MNEAWFYRLGESQLGPVSTEELRRLIGTRQIGPAIAVWREGLPGWMPASQVPQLLPSEGGLKFIVPTGRTSGASMAAGYLGLFGFFFPPLGLAALILGLIGVRDLRRNREKNGWGRAVTGIVLGGLLTALTIYFAVLILLKR
ncbi:MAG TPA: DUF4339 domain-containing protein [Labilithrix sp.]|jgi:hypothetical protein|nr:DUF4339 domain-containing protein [Labilithrix sp.]